MKRISYCVGILILLFFPVGKGSLMLSQKVTDELKAKLPKTEQYKLLKAETFNEKGKALLDKEGNLPDTFKIAANPTKEDQKKLDNFYSNRIKASYCFKTANGLIYEFVEQYIRGFWEKYKGDKRPLEAVLKVQNSAYDSLVVADNLRAKAEKEIYIDVTIPLVSRAEIIEKNSLFKLEKVLLIYMNWPEKPNLAWLYSNDANVPKNFVANTNPTKIEPAKKDTLHKASSIYSLLHISDNQIDKFNEFIKEKHPDKMKTYLLDFQGLYEDVIDSLHKEWHKYLYSGNVAEDTLTLMLKNYTNPSSTGTAPVTASTTVPNTINKAQKPVSTSTTVIPAGGNTKVVESKTAQGNTLASAEKPTTANKPPLVAAPVNNGSASKTPESKLVAETKKPIPKGNPTSEMQKKTSGPNPLIKKAPSDTTKAKQTDKINKNSLGENIKTSHKTTATNTDTLSKQRNQQVTNDIPVVSGKKANRPKVTQGPGGLLFKVQIAACRVRLSHDDLQSIYQGNEKIVESLENNWFRYSIGTFASFDTALDIRDRANVKGVFIAAYLNGKRVKIPRYLKKQASRQNN